MIIYFIPTYVIVALIIMVIGGAYAIVSRLAGILLIATMVVYLLAMIWIAYRSFRGEKKDPSSGCTDLSISW